MLTLRKLYGPKNRLMLLAFNLRKLDFNIRNDVSQGLISTCCNKCYQLDPVNDICAAGCYARIFSDDYFWTWILCQTILLAILKIKKGFSDAAETKPKTKITLKLLYWVGPVAFFYKSVFSDCVFSSESVFDLKNATGICQKRFSRKKTQLENFKSVFFY